MDYKDKVFAASFIGAMCCALSFVSVMEIAEQALAFKLGMILAFFFAATLIGGAVLYRRREVSFIADVWALAVTGVTAGFYAFFSYFFAKQLIGNIQAICLFVLWVMVVAMRFFIRESVRAKAYSLNTKIVAVVAACGGVAIGVLRAVSAMDGKIVVLVICNFLLACILGFLAAGFAKPNRA